MTLLGATAKLLVFIADNGLADLMDAIHLSYDPLRHKEYPTYNIEYVVDGFSKDGTAVWFPSTGGTLIDQKLILELFCHKIELPAKQEAIGEWLKYVDEAMAREIDRFSQNMYTTIRRNK